MGRKADMLSWYLSEPKVFADLLNGSLYDGRKVIMPEQLSDAQRTYDETAKDRNGRRRKLKRERDVAKLLRRGRHRIIIAVENQDSLNYCMPLRTMEYDVVEYARQLRRLREKYKQEGGLVGKEEFLSGIREEDKLIPAVTLVLYHGKGRWQTRMSLKDMLDLTGLDEKLQGLIENHYLNVVNLIDLEEENFETGLRELIGMMKRRDNKRTFLEYCRENADRFQNMDPDTCDLLCTMLNLKSLVWNMEIYKDQEKGTVNMCKAFEDWEKEAEARGEKRGEKRGKRKGIREGEEKFVRLLACLSRDDRKEDIFAVSQDRQVLQRLYQEYGI